MTAVHRKDRVSMLVTVPTVTFDTTGTFQGVIKLACVCLSSSLCVCSCHCVCLCVWMCVRVCVCVCVFTSPVMGCPGVLAIIAYASPALSPHSDGC